MKSLAILRARLGVFRDDLRGTVSIEAVIMLPLLFWAYVAMLTYFDAYRQASGAIKNSYTIGDMMSRETNAINNAYMNGAYSFLNFMSESADNAKLRVTVVRWDATTQKMKRDWSKTRGGAVALTTLEVENLRSRLTNLVDNERLIVVETWEHYVPPFAVGLAEQDLYNFVFTRPRFAPQLPWSDL